MLRLVECNTMFSLIFLVFCIIPLEALFIHEINIVPIWLNSHFLVVGDLSEALC